ncbi:MAG: hypothetical protein ACR2QR_10075, partial [Woeseiaceae bacterium]
LYLIVGSVFLAALMFLGVYAYWTNPGRLTTSPAFSGFSRSVSGNTLVSQEYPAIEMSFSEQFEYIGGQRFELYGTADVEQHFFVEDYPDGELKGFFWIQFESFLPSNTYSYDYSDSPLLQRIGDFEFYTDTAAGKSNRFFRLGTPGTDGYLARKFAADRGYNMPTNYMYARLVHIPDELSRRELLIIFIEDLAPTGLTGESLREGGTNEDRWKEFEKAHLEKVDHNMSLAGF